VIGPAVNRAARLQDLAKKLDRQVITSAAFADTVAEPLEDLGPHTLRWISDPERVYTMRP
jgi:adenylate cyclase